MEHLMELHGALINYIKWQQPQYPGIYFITKISIIWSCDHFHSKDRCNAKFLTCEISDYCRTAHACADDAHEWLWLINCFATQQTTRVFIFIHKFSSSTIYQLNWHYTTGCDLPRPQALIKKFHANHYMKGLHEVVRHIIGAQRGVGYERSG